MLQVWSGAQGTTVSSQPMPCSWFPVSLFLVVPKGETLPVVLFNYMKFDLDGAIAAASMVSILLALSVVLVLERLIGLKAYVKL